MEEDCSGNGDIKVDVWQYVAKYDVGVVLLKTVHGQQMKFVQYLLISSIAKNAPLPYLNEHVSSCGKRYLNMLSQSIEYVLL